LSDDYSRINTVVDRLINDEGIYVPWYIIKMNGGRVNSLPS
jgi:hypothetical protein